MDLPKGMSPEVMQLLKKVRVRNRPLNIAEDTGPRNDGPAPDFKRRGPKPGDKRAPGKFAGKGKPDGKGKPKTKVRDRDVKNKGYRAKKA